MNLILSHAIPFFQVLRGIADRAMALEHEATCSPEHPKLSREKYASQHHVNVTFILNDPRNQTGVNSIKRQTKFKYQLMLE